jgi:hypothetical protein
VPTERAFTWAARRRVRSGRRRRRVLVYPGGTYRDHSTSGYQFFHNFFSDLGATHFSGQSNPIARCSSSSVSSCWSSGWAAFRRLARAYSRSPRAVPLIRLAVVAGVFVCACFIGVAVTPENRFRSTHVLFTKLAFRVFPAVPLLLGLAASRGERSSRVGVAWVAMIALLVAYVVVLDFGPRVSTPIGLVVQVTAQKIVAVGAVLLLVYQSILAERVQQPVIAQQQLLVESGR